MYKNAFSISYIRNSDITQLHHFSEMHFTSMLTVMYALEADGAQDVVIALAPSNEALYSHGEITVAGIEHLESTGEL